MAAKHTITTTETNEFQYTDNGIKKQHCFIHGVSILFQQQLLAERSRLQLSASFHQVRLAEGVSTWNYDTVYD